MLKSSNYEEWFTLVFILLKYFEIIIGALDLIRTDHLLITNQLLYQMSYEGE